MRFAPDGDIEVIAHRGASAHAPEHTIEAYDLALEQGAHALELDVRMTGDRRLVVVHDPLLLRTTGDSRAVAEVPLRVLQALARPPLTLEEVFDRYGASTRYLLDLKDPRTGMPRAVAAAVRDAGLTRRVVVQGFDREWLRRLRRHDDSIATAVLFKPWRGRRGLVRAIEALSPRFTGIGVWYRWIDAPLVARAHARGLQLRAWTVNEPDEIARLVALGVDGIITDAPGVARGLIAAPVLAAA